MNPRKLLLKALQSPHNLRFAEACSLAEAFGFRLSRIGGSHHIYAHPEIPELLSLQEVQAMPRPAR